MHFSPTIIAKCKYKTARNFLKIYFLTHLLDVQVFDKRSSFLKNTSKHFMSQTKPKTTKMTKKQDVFMALQPPGNSEQYL